MHLNNDAFISKHKIYLEEIILKFNANIIKIILNNNNYKNII